MLTMSRLMKFCRRDASRLKRFDASLSFASVRLLKKLASARAQLVIDTALKARDPLGCIRDTSSGSGIPVARSTPGVPGTHSGLNDTRREMFTVGNLLRCT